MGLGKKGDSAVVIVLVYFNIFYCRCSSFNPIPEKAKFIADDVVVANGEESATNTP